MKIYGPYLHSDRNRKIVIIEDDLGVRRTVTNARYVLSKKLGRELTDEEEADHIDEDPMNDHPDNLQVLPKLQNIQKSALQRELFTGMCPTCLSMFEKPMNKVKHNKKQGKAGPFCSRRCAGKYKPL